jgi:photosystem II stability/assembly factor-like uncharacterized protein
MRRSSSESKKVPGGKAAARLAEFRTERGLPDVSSDHATSHYSKAIQEKNKQIAALNPKSPHPTWFPLGPFSIPHGQTYGTARPSVSGRISCIAIDPKNPAHLLLGSAAGGLWQSKDDGGTWSPVSGVGVECPMTVGAVVFRPGQSSVVYMGTGEGNQLSDYGVGLWRSTDSGSSWSVLAQNPFIGLGFYSLLIDPLDTNKMFAATTGGLFHSQDGGASWTAPLQFDNIAPLVTSCWDISMHPAVNGVANSTKEIFATTPKGVYQSLDGGSTWTKVTLTSAAAQPTRIAVCHDRAHGDAVYIFGQDIYGRCGLWRRTVFGGPFTSLFSPKGMDISQADYDWFLAVSPDDSNVLYLGAISLWKGEGQSDGSWKWQNISSREQGDSIHPDQHAIAFSSTNPKTIYVGNDGGVFKSPDGGITWTSLNKGLCITHFEYLAQHPVYDSWLIGGTQDNGTLRYEGSEAWNQVDGGDGGECAVSESSPYTAYHCFYYMTLYRSISGGGPDSWSNISPQVASDYSTLFYPPMEVKGDVVVQAGQSCFVSTDTGSTFTELSLPVDAGRTTALAIAGPFRFFAGTESGDVFRFDWAAGQWADAVTLQQPRAGTISSLKCDPTRADRLWATYSDYLGPNIYRSDDAGEKWEICKDGLPLAPVNIVEFDPLNTNIVFAGTDIGVWRSEDAGARWNIFSAGLPLVIVGDLAFQPKSRVLRAATRSRGVWEVNLNNIVQGPHIYIRHSVVDDAGRNLTANGEPDPFAPLQTANWWDSPDILVDSPPYLTKSIKDFDFVAFADGRRAGIQPAQDRARIFVQVHHRGDSAAVKPVVRLLCASADANALPPLPAGFWNAFPSGPLPKGSSWTAIGSRTALSGLNTGQPQVAAFEWSVPAKLSGKNVWLLALVTADNDKLSTAELDVSALVQGQAKCALKNIGLAKAE